MNKNYLHFLQKSVVLNKIVIFLIINDLNLKCIFFILLFRLDWPVRALSFSYDGKMLASGSEDLYVDIADVTTGEKVSFDCR